MFAVLGPIGCVGLIRLTGLRALGFWREGQAGMQGLYSDQFRIRANICSSGFGPEPVPPRGIFQPVFRPVFSLAF